MRPSRKQMIGGTAALICLGVLVAGTSWVASPSNISVAVTPSDTPMPTLSETPSATPAPSETPPQILSKPLRVVRNQPQPSPFKSLESQP